MILLYVPSIIFLVNYLMPYLNAHKAGELTGTIFKMDSIKKNLVKNGRECLIGAMLLFHYVKKFFEFMVFHTHTSSHHTNGFKGLLKGVYHVAFCVLITSFSVWKCGVLIFTCQLVFLSACRIGTPIDSKAEYIVSYRFTTTHNT